MLDSLLRYGLIAVVALAALAWAFIAGRAWQPKARARGGFWYLEAILLLSGPVLECLVFLYPADLSGPIPAIARAVSLVCVGLAAWAVLQSATNARRGVGAVIAAMLFFYMAMIMSGLVGATPGIPEQYVTTPVLVLAFLVHGGYSAEWLLRAARFNLRLVVVLSLIAAIVLPLLAFNSDDSRSLFGIGRLEGITAHPNTLGAVAVVAVVIELKLSSSRVWVLIPFLALTFAQSNTSWIALILALAVRRDLLAKTLRFLAVAGVLLASSIVVIWPDKANALVGAVLGDNFTFNGRTKIWDAAMIGFNEYPIFGYGPTLLDQSYRDRYLPNFDAAAQAHNQLVQSLASAGIIGLLSLLVLAVVLYKRAGDLRRLGDATGLALLVLLTMRAATETPLRPGGAGLPTFILIVVICYIATSWEEQSALRATEGTSNAVIREDELPSHVRPEPIPLRSSASIAGDARANRPRGRESRARPA
ncbi:O-antigen ligase family protein [Cryobacterium sp. SO2]|uniref:O-antigen ligase family protein n=1 Tax=Cryobacterium sp. SO2 TaxID=1897060 RepID=UPI00223CDA62|nr:O-antigen ligase family protein [Cryobacterium sp. SO2]WEO77988.1 O-antigen ligase family protein [Cryobacterium sp. SO2]